MKTYIRQWKTDINQGTTNIGQLKTDIEQGNADIGQNGRINHEFCSHLLADPLTLPGAFRICLVPQLPSQSRPAKTVKDNAASHKIDYVAQSWDILKPEGFSLNRLEDDSV